MTASAKYTRSQSHSESRSDYSSCYLYYPSADNCLTAIPSFKNGILQEHTARHLFHHYGQTIAATMAWVDTPDNQWRTTMISLALQSTPLLLSILAFAAEHLSSVTLSSCSALKKDLTIRAHNYRDSALSLLASDMRSTTIMPEALKPREGAAAVTRSETVNSVLASMLMLCNMETIHPDSRLWRLHLDAARTVANMQTTTSCSFKDETFRFLAEQLFIFDVFACTTSFEEINDQELLTEDNNSVFTEFLRLIKWVTSLERQSAAGRVQDPGNRIPSSELCRLFELARERTLASCSQTAFTTPAEREQFLGVIESFHHAGLIYSHRCLSIPDSEEKILQSRSALFQYLDLVQSDHPSFAQNVFWPLFIAGTEAQCDDGTRTVVEQKIKQAMKRTGFSNCEVALQFLRTLWIARDEGHSLSSPQDHNSKTDTGSEINWIQCARHWTSCGKQFLVY
ncbi:hypothetical protein DL98DRAFT_37483 [Cadophora sp. DSE1049]|nr:hypothetical protein DL98DRAFT_37483 [Cadophora sp. DSE1049]